MRTALKSFALPLAVILGVILACGSEGSTESAETSNVVMTGEEGIVTWGDGSSSAFWLAADEEALGLMTDASAARDVMGLNQLERSGRIYSTPTGTRVLVLDPGFLKTKVRVLEGEHTGRVGWQAREFVVPKP